MPIRLYPVPLRYLEDPKQYTLYQWIRVPIVKATRDRRPESFKIDPDRIECLEQVTTERGTWETRRPFVFRDPTWHFPTMRQLHQAQAASGRSMGMVKPGNVVDVRVQQKPPELQGSTSGSRISSRMSRTSSALSTSSSSTCPGRSCCCGNARSNVARAFVVRTQ